MAAAGHSMVRSGQSVTKLQGPAAVGVRTTREDFLKPWHRNEMSRNLKIIEDALAKAPQPEPCASDERRELPRFQHLFQGSELLPTTVFRAALELGSSESLNGRQLPYDADVLMLRDSLVMAYKPLQAKIRMLVLNEIEELPPRLLLNFARAWNEFESAWLRNREVHAVEALQPLAKAILSLEPLLLSVEKERLLPWPRVCHQKTVTLKCLEGFIDALSALAASVLPSLSRELDHDPRLLLLMDHVLTLRGENAGNHCLEGLSATPEVSFPNYKREVLSLDDYAFKLLGVSVGDAVAAGVKEADASAAGRGLTLSGTASLGDTLSAKATGGVAPPSVPKAKDSEIHRKAAQHASGLFAAFEGVKDMLLSLKSSLEHIDPALDEDQEFVKQLQRFERAFRKSKRLFLEPDNLA